MTKIYSILAIALASCLPCMALKPHTKYSREKLNLTSKINTKSVNDWCSYKDCEYDIDGESSLSFSQVFWLSFGSISIPLSIWITYMVVSAHYSWLRGTRLQILELFDRCVERHIKAHPEYRTLRTDYINALTDGNLNFFTEKVKEIHERTIDEFVEAGWTREAVETYMGNHWDDTYRLELVEKEKWCPNLEAAEKLLRNVGALSKDDESKLVVLKKR